MNSSRGLATACRLSKHYKPEVPNLHGKPSFSNVKRDLTKSPVLMIRHAASTSNAAASAVMKEASLTESKSLPIARWLETYGDENLIDARLTKDGVQQCLTSAEHAK